MVGTRFGAAKPSNASPHEARRSRPRHLGRWWRLHSGLGTDVSSRRHLCSGLRAPLTDASAWGARLKAQPMPPMGRQGCVGGAPRAPGVGEQKNYYTYPFSSTKFERCRTLLSRNSKNRINLFRKSKPYLVGRPAWALAREAYCAKRAALKQTWAPKTAVLELFELIPLVDSDF